MKNCACCDLLTNRSHMSRLSFALMAYLCNISFLPYVTFFHGIVYPPHHTFYTTNKIGTMTSKT